jgi:hypothetical protein
LQKNKYEENDPRATQILYVLMKWINEDKGEYCFIYDETTEA